MKIHQSCLFIIIITTTLFAYIDAQKPCGDHHSTSLNRSSFPAGFLFGAGSSAYQLALTVTKAIDFNAKVRTDTSTAVDEMLGEAQSLRSQVVNSDLALKQAREEAAKAKKAADQPLLSAVNEKLNAMDAAKRAAEEAAQAKEGEKHALQEAKQAKEEAARLKDEAARLREERNRARMDAQSWKESTYTVQAVLEGGEATEEIRARIIDQAKDAIIEEAHEDLFYSIWLEHPDQTYRTLGPEIDLLLEQFRARKAAEDTEASKVGEGVSDPLEAEEAEAVPDQEAPEVAPPATSHEDFLAPPAP